MIKTMMNMKTSKKSLKQKKNQRCVFTITRENYTDEMTETVLENEELVELLKKHNIEVISKDYLGARFCRDDWRRLASQLNIRRG